MTKKWIPLKNAPKMEGLRFRLLEGDSDFPKMITILNDAAAADNIDDVYTLEDLRHDYSHLTHSDPATDMLFAEIDGRTVAYCRVDWHQEEEPNDRIYFVIFNIHPDARGKGIEAPMLRWCETRLREKAAEHPQDSARFFQIYSNDKKTDYINILESMGYKPVRYAISMSRNLDTIPEAELPEGIEVRPVKREDCRKIWDASIEAFRDHWGFSEPEEEDYKSYESSKYFQPELWQVAWDEDEVVSSVMNYVDPDYNRKLDRKRGWTEEISTRREWRRRGIAKALIVRSMHMHKANGMTEVGLGVDTQNPNGALQLYQSLGYKKEHTFINFRKPM
jgi:GNAT superfamily N-acetyltransferase